MKFKDIHVAAIIVATTALICVAQARMFYKSRIPNGDRVPNPCQEGTFWSGVGHQSPAGADARNKFGLDFQAAGLQWTVDLCRKDSDGDGLTNGQELGDPDCVWTVGATPARTTGLSHPGICEFGSTKCSNAWTVCTKAFSCPAMNDPNVTVRNFTINATAVPPKEITYMCQAFELNNTASPVHLIGSRPLITNKNIVQHMIMYSCSTRPLEHLFGGPHDCFMSFENCTEILNPWTFGIEGICLNSDAGFRIGGEGHRYGLLLVGWNNPGRIAGYIDASGFSLYFSSTLRPHDLGTTVYGEVNIQLPPRQPLVNVNHTCPSVCTNMIHRETRYITMAAIHMHAFGYKGRVSLWRNGTLVQDLVPFQIYDYNSPTIMFFDPPVEYRRGDEVKTECYYSTINSRNTVIYGYGSDDEMCHSIMHYYPSNSLLSSVAKLSQCFAHSSLNECWLTIGASPVIENGCNVTDLLSGNMLSTIYSQMAYVRCLFRTACYIECRNYMNYTLFPSNACFDPKRSLAIVEAVHIGYLQNLPRSSNTNFYLQAIYPVVKICQTQIEMLPLLERLQMPSQPAAAPVGTASPVPCVAENTTTGLTSEHLLIIAVVCSCLGFALLVAILVLIGKSIKRKLPTPAAPPNDNEEEKAKVYKVYT